MVEKEKTAVVVEKEKAGMAKSVVAAVAYFVPKWFDFAVEAEKEKNKMTVARRFPDFGHYKLEDSVLELILDFAFEKTSC